MDERPWETDEQPLAQIRTITALYKLWYAYRQYVEEVLAYAPPSDADFSKPVLCIDGDGSGGVAYDGVRGGLVYLVRWGSLTEGTDTLKRKVREHQEARLRSETQMAIKARAVGRPVGEREVPAGGAAAGGEGEGAGE